MSAAAIVVAAGRGTRAGGEIPKQFRRLGEFPVLRWSLLAFAANPRFTQTIIVVHPDDELRVREAAQGLVVTIVPGGATRTQSVRSGLAAIAQDVAHVFIHDAARPGLEPSILNRLFDALADVDGAAPGLRIVDSLKRTDAAGNLLDAPARDNLWRIQTPQAFCSAPLLSAYAHIPTDAEYGDDFAVAAEAGLRLRLIEGSEHLAKITSPRDHDMVANLLGLNARIPCVGSGYDAHRFGPGDFVTLCGVRIAHTHGLIGHSDADAAWHALTDALLGALGAGDIGDHFPPTDPRWKGAPSDTFLAHAVTLARAAGAQITHADLTLVCERPKIKPHREAMRTQTAAVLGIPVQRVSVKATTTEEMGFTGRSEGLAAQATVTLLAPPTSGLDPRAGERD